MALEDIKQRIAAAEARARRGAGSVRLIAVSKKQPGDRIEGVLVAGHRLFGENRVQEAAERWPAFADRYEGIELHLLGPLQTNKARHAIGLFQAIHSLDRPRLANALARLADETGSCPELFVQVNTGEEPQKSGISTAETDAFVAECRALDLPVLGLMCIPPADEDPAAHFGLLAALAERNGLAGLSMGMSADFEGAIAAGATHVRIGSAVFGERPED